MKNIIITGAPGTGKTSIINSLNQLGYNTYEEIPRKLITEKIPEKHGIRPFDNIDAFASLVFDEMFKQYKNAANLQTISFFDRALPDVIAYLKESSLDIPDIYYSIIKNCKYFKTVFFCPPWELIYKEDKIRPYKYEKILSLSHSLSNTYKKFGFELYNLPKTSIEKRSYLIINNIKNN